jgi:hypothetical protein
MESAHDNDFTLNEEALAVSLELSGKSWKIGLHDGKRDKPAIYTVGDESPAGRLGHTVAVIEETKKKWGLLPDVRVAVSYEAGQDAFWISRALTRIGYAPLVVDPASIPVERHTGRAKTDRLDVIKLVNSLRAWLRGERDRMHVIQVPAGKRKRSGSCRATGASCRRKSGSIATVSASCCARWDAGTVLEAISRNASHEATSNATTARPCRRSCMTASRENVNDWRWQKRSWRRWKKTWCSSCRRSCRNASRT